MVTYISRYAAPGMAYLGNYPHAKPCVECTASFLAHSPSQVRCPACQSVRAEKQFAKSCAKAKAKRVAAREARKRVSRQRAESSAA